MGKTNTRAILRLPAFAAIAAVAAGIPAQGPIAPPPGLVGWWALDGNANDFGPGELHGALAGAGGVFEFGMVLDGFRSAGPDGHVAVPDAPQLDVRNNFTYECWVLLDGLRFGPNYLVNKGSRNQVTTPYSFGVIGNDGGLAVTPGASRTGTPGPARPFVVTSDGLLEQAVFAGNPVPLGVFTHVAFTVAQVGTAFQCRIYMNGTQTGFAWLGRLPFNGADPLQVGGVAGNTALDGVVDEMTLYDRALTQAEILAIYTAGPDGKIKPRIDITPPLVQIDQPLDGAVLGNRAVSVQATVTDESPTQVSSTPPGVVASLPAGGGIATGTVTLIGADGAHVIAVRAIDLPGNPAANSVTVVLDTTPPSLTIVSPVEGAVVGVSPVQFAIRVVDLTGTMVEVGGQIRVLPGGQSAFTVDVPLVEGNNAILVTATDEAGNQTVAIRNVMLDLTAPVVTILSPPDGALFGAGQTAAAVQARVDDLGATTVASTPAGVAGSLPAGGGLLSGAVSLQEGLNQISVTATDEVGRVGSAGITVNLDTTAPTVQFISPASGAGLRSTVEVLLEAADVAPGSGVVRIDLFSAAGLLASGPGATLRYDLDTIMLLDGTQTLRAVAVDGAGNEGVATLTVLVDNTPPVLQVLTPMANETVQGTMSFVVQASDAGSGLTTVVQRVGGNAPTTGGSATFDPPSASAQVSATEDTRQWPNGTLVLEAEATDSVGNRTVVQVEVQVLNQQQTEPPGLRPRDGATVHRRIRLKLTSDRMDLTALEILVDGQLVAQGVTSPLMVSFDTTTRLDGPMEVRGIVRTVTGGRADTVHTLNVDNIRLLAMLPHYLSLNGECEGREGVALVYGPNADTMRSLSEHRLELRVPGGTAVPLVGSHRRDRGRLMIFVFDRAAMVAALRAAQATGVLPPKCGRVRVTLHVDGVEIGHSHIHVRQEAPRGSRR